MKSVFLRKYGEEATITFDLFQADGIDFRVDAVYASGDVLIMKDEGAEASTTNGFTDEGNGYSIVLTAAEMQAARIVLYFIDQTATKVWLDHSIVIETYGHASAMHAFDLDIANDASSYLVNGTYGLSALKDLMDSLSTQTTIVDNVVDTIQARVENSLYGLNALRVLIDSLSAELSSAAEVATVSSGTVSNTSARVVSILTKVRDSLSDPDADRWSDSRLLRILGEGIEDITRKGRLLRTKIDVPVFANVNTYELPTDAHLITRAINEQGEKIDVLSHAEMDEIDPLWETRVGSTIEQVIYDKQNLRTFKIHPIPSADLGSTFTFIFSDFGLVSLIEDDLVTSDFGVIADVEDNAVEILQMSSDFGIVTGMEEYDTHLTVYYSERPADITVSTNVIEIDSVFDKALKHYVIGHALRDDKDTQNRQVGNEELAFYFEERDRALKESTQDFTTVPKRTAYRSGF